MNLQEIRDLDFNDLGGASTGAKAFLLIVIAVAILAAGYWFIVKDQRTQLQSVERTETELRNEFENKQRKAASLSVYEQQLDEMRVMLRSLLRQLPSRTEMPDLLVDISQTALASGIETELFEPRGEVLKDFYAELPIAIRMSGSYHQFGSFVSGVASLSRVVILTMQDIELEPVEGRPGTLRMEGTVTTYRYLDDSEETDLLLEGES
ncbi:type 4a pilus biogenesis protein PilO [Wenzhouxiangella sp. XN79A]|uniref:type 4a pilus biogenesis protein PilO n=1 Tax=Wenzhouxiangella sp. XN79A TaxID=2724193 RepID=UPI00144ADCB9|nr:type 4a pilus biogenesis protein PilO [Wenzhouxiangella sp. XN79A]NKI35303.1 type 4a pilus biogenesis protein PilO [Wenzhouxiangella sp. XN79A]